MYNLEYLLKSFIPIVTSLHLFKTLFLILIFSFYANGSAFIWMFYECEKDDIIMMICPEGTNTKDFALQFVQTALSNHHKQQGKHLIRIIESEIKVSVSTLHYVDHQIIVYAYLTILQNPEHSLHLGFPPSYFIPPEVLINLLSYV